MHSAILGVQPFYASLEIFLGGILDRVGGGGARCRARQEEEVFISIPSGVAAPPPRHRSCRGRTERPNTINKRRRAAAEPLLASGAWLGDRSSHAARRPDLRGGERHPPPPPVLGIDRSKDCWLCSGVPRRPGAILGKGPQRRVTESSQEESSGSRAERATQESSDMGRGGGANWPRGGGKGGGRSRRRGLNTGLRLWQERETRRRPERGACRERRSAVPLSRRPPPPARRLTC